MNIFKTGQKLFTRSTTNSESTLSAKVINRSLKTVAIRLDNQTSNGLIKCEEKCCRIHLSTAGEFIYPLGRYLLAPIFRA